MTAQQDYDHARYLRTKERYAAQRRAAGRPFLRKRRAMVNAIKLERGCADCGYNEYAVALDFDHRGEKVADIASLYDKALGRLMAEIEKCDVVCANCHRVRTAERASWPSSAKESA